jgi:hypothetical protein
MKITINLVRLLIIVFLIIFGSFWIAYWSLTDQYGATKGVVRLPKDANVQIQVGEGRDAPTVDRQSANVLIDSNWLVDHQRKALIKAYTKALTFSFVISLIAYFLYGRNKRCEHPGPSGRDTAAKP